MRVLHLTALGLVLFFSAPAMAGDSTNCWTFGTETGIFDWQQSPSQACRAGQNVDGSAEDTTVAPILANAATARTDGIDGARTNVTFSGEAYVGIAATF